MPTVKKYIKKHKVKSQLKTSKRNIKSKNKSNSNRKISRRLSIKGGGNNNVEPDYFTVANSTQSPYTMISPVPETNETRKNMPEIGENFKYNEKTHTWYEKISDHNQYRKLRFTDDGFLVRDPTDKQIYSRENFQIRSKDTLRPGQGPRNRGRSEAEIAAYMSALSPAAIKMLDRLRAGKYGPKHTLQESRKDIQVSPVSSVKEHSLPSVNKSVSSSKRKNPSSKWSFGSFFKKIRGKKK